MPAFFVYSAQAAPSFENGDNSIQPISITITSPENGSKIYSDVVPHRLRVLANISSEYGIAKITLESDYETKETIPSENIADEICFNGSGEKSVVVRVWDDKGNSAYEKTEFTIITGPPPPPVVSVYGRVTGTDGEPVEGCIVSVNSTVFSSKGVYTGSANTTDSDGRYIVENVPGRKVKISAEKEGFKDYSVPESFEETVSEFNITMEPEKKESAGSGFAAVIFGILAALCIMTFIFEGKNK
ncbi:carboxypeptidase-like regulatory domain-containing protein [Methanomicrobium sp. W14]|uniref:carboxypeptidase-like regulatory domain-containing protein n=1 Tax=Methanomicrobium sp. W14 TaxID=2817839 RepID=UPI001AE40833|nr:carboxypeptidase-like regulatory domain-containing protein [Methanomicrobium sp. W14]